jgi:hypothetical protein
MKKIDRIKKEWEGKKCIYKSKQIQITEIYVDCKCCIIVIDEIELPAIHIRSLESFLMANFFKIETDKIL